MPKIIYIILIAIVLIAAVFFLFYFNFVPKKNALNPEQTTTAFYQWYINQPQKPLLSGSYQQSGFLTSNFAKKTAKKIDEFKQSGLDPFLCSVNTVPSFSIIQKPKASLGNAEVILEQIDGLKTNQVKVSLVLQNRKWKIAKIECFYAKPQEITLKVYFSNSQFNPGMQDCSQVYPVERVVAKTPQVAKAALLQLFGGPTNIEKAQGYTSWFSQSTADILESVKIKNNIAFVNLKRDFTSVIPGASSSCGSAEFLAEMTNTLKQFSEIKDIIFAIDANVSWFYSFLQLGCPEISNNCDNSEFK